MDFSELMLPASTDVCEPDHVGPRGTGDDFYCHRYAVWYPSIDCAFRTRFRTSAGCLNCDQGRFNLRRHGAALRAFRWTGPTAG